MPDGSDVKRLKQEDTNYRLRSTHEVLNTMEQGVLVWTEDGICEMHTDRALDILEIGKGSLYPGIARSDFLQMSVDRGEIDAKTKEEAEAQFANRATFAFDRTLPSGKMVSTNVRPLQTGGFVVTFTDVTEARKAAQELEVSKKAAQQAELKALRTLAAEQVWKSEAKLLAELDEWLQVCKSLTELYEIVGAFMPRILPSTKGELYIYSNSRDVLDGACKWGGQHMHDHITPDSCWALRRGRHYYHTPNELSFCCDHVKEHTVETDNLNYLCIPIVAHGDTVGLLHVGFPDDATEEESEASLRFTSQCAEHISLAVANVKLRDELHDQSTRDPLTGLYNRRFFMDAFRNELNMSQRKEDALSVLSFDADKFKTFNDNHGHDAGDMVLRAIGEKMGEIMRSDDICCRFGGEEFVVLLPKTKLKDAMTAAEKLRSSIEDTKIRYGTSNLPRVTVSIGVSSFPDHGNMPQDLLNAADQALYAAKDAGRNCIRSACSVED